MEGVEERATISNSYSTNDQQGQRQSNNDPWGRDKVRVRDKETVAGLETNQDGWECLETYHF